MFFRAALKFRPSGKIVIAGTETTIGPAKFRKGIALPLLLNFVEIIIRFLFHPIFFIETSSKKLDKE